MFELSLAELAVVAGVALVVIGPNELPEALRAFMKAIRAIKHTVAEIKGGVNTLLAESGLNEAGEEIEKPLRYIRDLEGNLQPTYDVPPRTEKPADE